MSGTARRLSPWPLAALAMGTAAVVASFHVPVDYTPTGGRTLEGWTLAMLGISLAIAVAPWSTRWRKAGLLSSLFVLGVASQLVLTFPHWAMSLRISPGQIERPEHLLALAVIAAEWLVVLILTAPLGAPLFRLVRTAMSPLRWLVVVAIFLVVAANVAAYYPQLFEGGYWARLYARWLVGAASVLAVNLLLLLHVARSLPEEPLGRLARRVSSQLSLPGERGPPKPLDGRLPWYLAAFVLVVAGFFARVILAGTAQFGDEVVYQFMADVYASGSLRVPAPPVPEAFEMYLVEVRHGWRYGVFIPGWPLVLSIGSLFGVPWLVNPLLGALSVPAAHALCTRLIDRGTAHVVAVLLSVSPWFLILSSVYQPHAVTLLAALIAWLGVHHAKTDGGVGWAFVAGLAAGVAFSVRPLDGLVIGGAGGLFALVRLGGGRAALGSVATYVLGCVATGAVSLAINYALTGDPLSYAMNEYFDREWGVGANRLGFGADVGQVWGVLDPMPGHGIRDVLFGLNLNLFTLNYEMLGWGIGSLTLVAIHLLWGRLTAMDRAWLAFVVGAVAVYGLYWFSGGPDYGPRYWYSTLFPLLILSAKGLGTAIGRLGEWTDTLLLGARAGILVGLLAFTGVAVYGSWRAVAKYVDYRSKTPLFRELMEAGAFGADGLVLVDAQGEGEYAALELNELVPGSSERPVFARNLGPEVSAELMSAFPTRSVYRAELTFTPEGKVVSVDTLRLRSGAATGS